MYLKWAWQPKNFQVRFTCQWLNPLSKFLNPPLLVVAIEGQIGLKNHLAKEVQSYNFKGISTHV